MLRVLTSSYLQTLYMDTHNMRPLVKKGAGCSVKKCGAPTVRCKLATVPCEAALSKFGLAF